MNNTECTFNDKYCGEFKRGRDNNKYHDKDLNRSCKDHLVSLKLYRHIDPDPGLSEKQLIQSRINKELYSDDTIRSYHR